jgi:hypothetical protein
LKKFEIPVSFVKHNIDVLLRDKHNIDVVMRDKRNIGIVMRDKCNVNVLVRKVPIVNLSFILKDIPDSGEMEFKIIDAGRLTLSASDAKMVTGRLRMLYEMDDFALDNFDEDDIAYVDIIIEEE